MPTLPEWLDGKTKDGRELPADKVAAYRRRHASPNVTIRLPDRKEKRNLNRIPKNSDGKELVLQGVGTEFGGLMLLLGIKMSEKCDCKAAMFYMNEIGVASCRSKFDDLVALLKDNSRKWGWTAHFGNWIKAGLNWARNPEIRSRVNPLDPIPDLLRFAIELAEKKGTAN